MKVKVDKELIEKKRIEMKEGYTPNRAEAKLLEIISDPEFIGASVTDICIAAGVSRDTYYRVYKKPEFVELINSESNNLLIQNLLPIYNAIIKGAKGGNPQQQDMLLKLMGKYIERQQVDKRVSVVIERSYERDDRPIDTVAEIINEEI